MTCSNFLFKKLPVRPSKYPPGIMGKKVGVLKNETPASTRILFFELPTLYRGKK